MCEAPSAADSAIRWRALGVRSFVPGPADTRGGRLTTLPLVSPADLPITRLSTSPARKISAVPDLPPAEVSDELALDLYYWMTLTRGVEERALNLYRQGKLPGSYYTGRGQEAISVGMALPLRAGRTATGCRRGSAISAPTSSTASRVADLRPVHGQGRIDDARQGRQPAHRRQRVEHPLPGVAHGGHDPAHGRRRPGLQAARRGPRGGHLVRRRRHLARRLPRGPEHRGRARGAGRVRGREQPLGATRRRSASRPRSPTCTRRPPATASRRSRSTATTCSPCTPR